MALEVLSLNSNCRGIMHALCVPYTCGFLNVCDLKYCENLVFAYNNGNTLVEFFACHCKNGFVILTKK